MSKFSESESGEVTYWGTTRFCGAVACEGRYDEKLRGSCSTGPFAYWLLHRTLSWRELWNDYCSGASANIYA
jgi:hypothetical protein